MTSGAVELVPVPLEVWWDALRTAADGAAGIGVHGVLEHGAPIADAARPSEGFATVLAWAWRWDQGVTLELLALYLGALHHALDEPDAAPDQRFRLDDALGSISSALSAESLLGDQGAAELAARARVELPRIEPRLGP